MCAKAKIGGRVSDDQSKAHLAKELKGNLTEPDFLDVRTGQILDYNEYGCSMA